MQDTHPPFVEEPAYHFPWPLLDAVMAGRSAIDLDHLAIHDREQALAFIRAYGFEPADPGDARDMAEVMALTRLFIDEQLLPYGGLTTVPDDLVGDWEDLLLQASQPMHPLSRWSCSFLRVAHAVCHGRYIEEQAFLGAARELVFSRFKSHIRQSATGLFLGDEHLAIPLLRLDLKPEKPWQSIVLKLLQKPDSVAQEIYDHIGVRLVTPDLAYALLAVKYLRSRHVFSFPHVKPSRSVNTLVDVAAFREGFEALRKAYKAGQLDETAFHSQVHALHCTPKRPRKRANPHSGDSYRAIQFTCRVMVKIELQDGRVQRSFLPFEVQIMDMAAYNDAQHGAGSYASYKERQKRTACQRIFPWAT